MRDQDPESLAEALSAMRTLSTLNMRIEGRKKPEDSTDLFSKKMPSLPLWKVKRKADLSQLQNE